MIKKTLILLFMLGQIALAQDPVNIAGDVYDDTGAPLPGASVVIKGTTTGVSTDFDGHFELPGVLATDVIVISFIGLLPQEITVGSQTNFNITLKSDASDLEEVVVIGYGTSKSKDLTSPIATVSAEEITSMNTSSAMGAVQGKLPGVTIVSSGVPGDGPAVSIRGVGSFEDTSPLYVVDGMFLDDINFLNPNDIETMSILKDASAAAIYGVRAANGVVLITTKSGSKDRKPTVTYDGYYGVQNVSQRLEMANSQQYADFMRASGDPDLAALIDASIARYGGSNGYPSVSTDWYEELIKNNASIQNHSLSLTGGTEKTAYAFSAGYFKQDGIMDATGEYERINFRAKVDFDISDKVKIGFTSLLTNEDKMTDDSQAWFQAYVNAPTYPVYDETQSSEESYPIKFANPHNLGYDTYYTNPAAVAYYRGDNKTDGTRFMPSIYLEVDPFNNKDIKFRTALNIDYRYEANTLYTPEYKSGNNIQQINQLSKTTRWDYDYVWDNTITWDNQWDRHRLKSMVGFSVREENHRWLQGTAQGVQNKEYINTGDESTTRSYDGGTKFKGLSAFARFSYDYLNKYILSVTMRADGSSKYQDKWGYFPSVGAGWVISEEDFFAGVRGSGFDFFKLRASWGMLGNDKVPANDGFASITTGGLNESGIFGGSNLIPGMLNNSVYSSLAWEVVYETNVGIDTKFLDYRLNFEADYYSRDTKDMVIRTVLPMGNGSILRNTGSVRNSGIEILVGWSDKVGSDFRYSVGGNLTTIKNEVLDLGNEPYIQTGTAEYPQRSVVGEALYSFYGYKVDGVYQNQTEIDNDPIAVANGLEPGDLKFSDLNKDGKIDSDDRTLIGKPNADFTYGFNFSAGYKGFTLAAAFQGVQGASIFNRKRADINKHPINNLDADLADNVWSGEGSSNTYPSAKGMFNTWNNARLSDFYIEDGSYFRIQNIRLSYDFSSDLVNKAKLSAVQLYINADRPFTSFKSNGFTPEVPGGIDETVYPIPSIYSLGARISF
ncbi:SusC/RagA family TonB-linked outer membrane protein [Saccharicrinis aurantiacus]|uniref:SusC/RagA family TonB-linked outer membrane protein n=1 Tax=Saccharicrinis aurantiacus TaxID=1849719 RepID=UPI0009502426|nr:TonB-dependent receptor [Saccharicrinis aurantiacus]